MQEQKNKKKEKCENKKCDKRYGKINTKTGEHEKYKIKHKNNNK